MTEKKEQHNRSPLKNITVMQRSLPACILFHNNYAIVQETLFLKVIFRHGTRSQFSSFLLLHSNSQLANLLFLPAKNASWGSTPIVFTVLSRMNQVFSGTKDDAVESRLCSAACPWKADGPHHLALHLTLSISNTTLCLSEGLITLAILYKDSSKLAICIELCV